MHFILGPVPSVLRLPLKTHFFHVTADIGTYPKIRILVTRAATTK